MIVENKLNYYIGTITYVENDPLGLLTKDKLYHEAVVAVPGVFENVLAFPTRNQLDEPKIGDLVIVAAWDSVYNSYCTYEKLKENDFVGFRAHGKMVQIDHEKIVAGVFDEETEYKDSEVPDVSKIAHIEMDKDGNLTVHAAKDITVNGDANCTITIKGDSTIKVEGNSKINVDGNSDIKIGGDAKLEISGNSESKISGNSKEEVSGNLEVKSGGNADIEASGNATIKSPNVSITGGMLKVKGTAVPDMQGPFCVPKNCIFSGAPISGSLVSGT